MFLLVCNAVGFLRQDFDETILERIAALSEMFPECVQNATSKLVFGSLATIKGNIGFWWLYRCTIFNTNIHIFTQVYIPLPVPLPG